MKKRMKSVALAMSIIIGCGIFTACGSNVKEGNSSNKSNSQSKEEQKEVSFEDESYFVTEEWLNKNLDDENIVILDARGEKPYSKSHIPGAIAVTWQQFSNMEGTSSDIGWGEILEPEKLSKKLSELGIDESKTVIAYCDPTNSWGDEGRIVWMLRKAGIENSKMLDGGIAKWEGLGYETTKEVPEIKATDYKIDKFDDSMTITTEELKNELNDVVILDSREKSEYDGAIKYGEVRGGHIPGAINIPFNTFLNEDGTFKSPNEIQKILDENGISKDEKIVTYCTAGIRSGHLALVLKMMGYDNVRNYDASFYAWAADKNLEVEK